MLPFSWGEVRLSAFYDWGEIRKYHDDSNLVSKNNIYSLEGYGLGVNVSRPGSMDFDLIWSHRMGNNPEPNADGSDNDGSRRLNRIWTSLRFYF